jgi:hypothetical protein
MGARGDRLATYRGACDASAGVLDADRLLVATDEDNVLRCYVLGEEEPVAAFDLSPFLEVDEDRPESDIEGAARIDDLVYWIGSHARSSRGKRRPSRHRFFATTFRVDAGGRLEVAPQGRPVKDLLDHLLDYSDVHQLGLREASKRGPEEPGGLNVEALAAWGGLLVGFRNPVFAKGALAVPLLNPREVIFGEAAPRFAAPLFADLGGRGIRAMAPSGEGLFVVAGAPDDRGRFALFHWHPDRGTVELLEVDFDDLRPEAVLVSHARRSLLFLSDDGGLKWKGKRCKDRPRAKRRFRILEVPEGTGDGGGR